MYLLTIKRNKRKPQQLSKPKPTPSFPRCHIWVPIWLVVFFSIVWLAEPWERLKGGGCEWWRLCMVVNGSNFFCVLKELSLKNRTWSHSFIMSYETQHQEYHFASVWVGSNKQKQSGDFILPSLLSEVRGFHVYMQCSLLRRKPH